MNIVIVDTGCANLSSVRWAIQRLGYQPQISHEIEAITQADKLLLPGVGTAAAAMQQLRERQLTALICGCRQPILGICLGMQLFGTVSVERGTTDMLHIIPAPISALPEMGLPLPHMGWNQISIRQQSPLFRSIAEGSRFYFVHSYAMPVCTYTLAECHYGAPFSAAIQKENFFGVQFHPERSGAAGAQLLKNFLEM